MAKEPYNERQSIRDSRSNRFLSRTSYRKHRKTICTNSVPSSDGLSASVKRGRTLEEEWSNTRSEGLKMKFIKTHPLSVSYWAIFFIVGIMWQVGIIHI